MPRERAWGRVDSRLWWHDYVALCSGLLEVVVRLGLDVCDAVDEQLDELIVLGRERVLDLGELRLVVAVDLLLHRGLRTLELVSTHAPGSQMR